jgi:hypothetical protein
MNQSQVLHCTITGFLLSHWGATPSSWVRIASGSPRVHRSKAFCITLSKLLGVLNVKGFVERRKENKSNEWIFGVLRIVSFRVSLNFCHWKLLLEGLMIWTNSDVCVFFNLLTFTWGLVILLKSFCPYEMKKASQKLISETCKKLYVIILNFQTQNMY